MTTPIEPRWYCVDALGHASWCLSEAHARTMAETEELWNIANSPHRAVLLGDVAAERETIQRLREALERVLKARDAEAAANGSYQVALDNGNPTWRKREADRHMAAMLEASAAERDARALLDGKADHSPDVTKKV